MNRARARARSAARAREQLVVGELARCKGIVEQLQRELQSATHPAHVERLTHNTRRVERAIADMREQLALIRTEIKELSY